MPGVCSDTHFPSELVWPKQLVFATKNSGCGYGSEFQPPEYGPRVLVLEVPFNQRNPFEGYPIADRQGEDTVDGQNPLRTT